MRSDIPYASIRMARSVRRAGRLPSAAAAASSATVVRNGPALAGTSLGSGPAQKQRSD